MTTPTAQPDSLAKWRAHRRRSYRQWWLYMAVSLAGTTLLAVNLRRGDPIALAALLAAVLLALRGAWKSDRQIQICEAEIAAKSKSQA